MIESRHVSLQKVRDPATLSQEDGRRIPTTTRGSASPPHPIPPPPRAHQLRHSRARPTMLPAHNRPNSAKVSKPLALQPLCGKLIII